MNKDAENDVLIYFKITDVVFWLYFWALDSILKCHIISLVLEKKNTDAYYVDKQGGGG